MKEYEMVNHPDHYNIGCPVLYKQMSGKINSFKIECIDVIRNMATWKGNAIKYLWRAGLKPDAGLNDIDKEIEDCNKAIWYIQDHIHELEAKKITEN